MSETFTHNDLTIRVEQQEVIESFDNPRNFDGNVAHFYCWHPDYILGDEQFTHADHPDRSMEQIGEWLKKEREAIAVMPLYLLDHSGLHLSTARSIADPGGWDTTHVGFAYVTAESLSENGLDEQVDLNKLISDEVAAYSAYLEGSVMSYTVSNAEGEIIDSCGGFLIITNDDMDYVRKAAIEAADEALSAA